MIASADKKTSTSQSWSDERSLGRYFIPLFSSSVSTSSGTLPLTRTAYIPRTYLAGEVNVNKVEWNRTCMEYPGESSCYHNRYGRQLENK